MEKQKKYKTEETGHYSGVMPEMTVMQPIVVNVSNPPESKSVARKRLESDVKFSPVSESSYDGIKGGFLLDDELAHFIPSKEIKIPDVNLDYQNESGK